MIIVSRCPYRISLLGGGSDLISFLEKFDKGLCIGFSIPLYSRVVLSYRNSDSLHGILNYSSREEYSDLNSICHPIIRNCLQILNIKKPIELASFGEPISGTGLGSSSSFTVALIQGLYALQKIEISNEEIANIACQVEIEKMKKPIGKQDQYLCALGGVNILEFQKNKKVIKKKSHKINDAIYKFMENTFLVNTGINRSASKVLKKISSNSDNFEYIKEIYNVAYDFLNEINNDQNIITKNLEKSIIKSWSLKRNIVGTMNEKLIDIESFLEKKNFQILKLLGAGGGGYFLVKYKGENFNKDNEFLIKKNLHISKVSISKSGSDFYRL